jgi:hypothetical protein
MNNVLFFKGFDLIDPRRRFLRQGTTLNNTHRFNFFKSVTNTFENDELYLMMIGTFEMVESTDPLKVIDKKVVLFLFNDVLLLAKEKEKDHFHVRAMFWLVETLAWNVKKLGGREIK